MFASGQKRTSGLNSMLSALPPEKQTSGGLASMSAEQHPQLPLFGA